MAKYVMALDSGTTSNRCILFNEKGEMCSVAQKEFTQYFPKPGWVEHDANEIWSTQLGVAVEAMSKIGATAEDIAAIGITNQRETTIVWDKETGEPVYHAIVWQCRRTSEYCDSLKDKGLVDTFRAKTGLVIDAYFSGTKLKWILDNVEGVRERAEKGELLFGTVETWLIWKLTKGRVHVTDYSNASRTQLFNIFDLKWDEEICGLFGIDPANMAEVTDSDACFGETDFEGLLPHKIPIHGVLGDSHGSLFGQGCLQPGMIKSTYGTGSSIMMNIGEKPILSTHGVVTSLAWKIGGKVNYVLEGNLNYTGAVITWLKDDLQIISSPGETGKLAKEAIQEDSLYLVPAFSGLGAPYWDSEARASVVGMSRTTRKAEFVRAALECIAYQITDVVKAMSEDSKICIGQLCVDGGPTRNAYLMQFQSDLLIADVMVPDAEELSAIGPAYAAGLRLGLWDETIFTKLKRTAYKPSMEDKKRTQKYAGWKEAVKSVLCHNKMAGKD